MALKRLRITLAKSSSRHRGCRPVHVFSADEASFQTPFRKPGWQTEHITYSP
jgi:hypothetical protein